MIGKQRHKLGYILVILSIVVSLIEVIGISLIMPFVQIAIDFENIHTNKYFEELFQRFNIHSDATFVVYVGLFLIVFYLFRSVLNTFYYYMIAKFSRESYFDISMKLFKDTLMMPYRDFKGKNSSHVIQAVSSEALNVSYMITSLITLVGEMTIVFLIYGLMLYVNWKLTMILTVFLVMNALILKMTLTKILKQAGSSRAEAQKSFYEILNSSLGNFKFIKLRTEEDKIVEQFAHKNKKLVKAYTIGETISHIPRVYLETLGFILVLLLIIYWVGMTDSDVSEKMGILSLFIIALYRLMPSFNRIISQYNQLIFMKPAFDFVKEHLEHDIEGKSLDPVVFEKSITLDHVSFFYEENKPVLKDLSMVIYKGEKIAFMGESGGGKSTLVDLIMGLLVANEGCLYVDNRILNEDNYRAWRSRIGYIPQDIYLFDGTVAQNVAFSLAEDVDEKRVKQVLRQAKILDFLEVQLDGIDTEVGEGGAKLSGGQKQRIAIARALYHEPEVLVLDEATSALDSETEKKIMKEIYEISKDKTLLIIAHRLSTIQGCDRTFEVKDGQVYELPSLKINFKKDNNK